MVGLEKKTIKSRFARARMQVFMVELTYDIGYTIFNTINIFIYLV